MHLLPSLITACALAAACAVLSVFVVLRRWALLGEGVAHSSFGGAGVAWALALLVPALDRPWVPYVTVMIVCLATAVGVGALSSPHRQRVNPDTAIGIFLVASLAWGFVAQQLYVQHRGVQPAWYGDLLLGQVKNVSVEYAVAAAAVSLAVVLTIAALGKEILAYSFDPLTARTSGVRTGAVHYLLMLLIGLVMVIGVRVVGSLMVTALLVLPGASALLLSRRLSTVLTFSVIAALTGVIAGLLVNARWAYLPVGPAIVLTLVLVFVAAYVVSRSTGPAAAES
jgi:ABC-type Mn2+/Zn2+ transport system permease subunit